MRRNRKKWLLLTGMCMVMSLAVYGCGGKDAAVHEEQTEPVQETPKEAPVSDENEDQAGQQTSSDTEEKDNKDATRERKDGEGDLNGDISVLEDGQFTIIVNESETTEDGSAVLVGPAEGADDSEFEKATVAYDTHTDIYIRTIYDGGASFEDSDADASALKEGSTVLVWGAYEEDGKTFHADQIQIDEFVY